MISQTIANSVARTAKNCWVGVFFFFFVISCQERGGYKQIFLYFEKDVLFYNILMEGKQTSLANAF